jgi:hypothetical protein
MLTALLAAGPSPASSEEVLARGPCYVKQFSAAELAKSPDLAVRRIELQINRFHPPRPGGEAANRQIEIGLTPRSGDDAPSTASTGDCTGTGLTLTCTLTCDGNGEGRFRISPAGKDRIRFSPDGPIAADACFDGVPAFELPDVPAHKSFVLQLAGGSDCFH